MKILAESIQVSGRALKTAALAFRWDRFQETPPGDGRAPGAPSLERYVSGVYQSLAVFRLAAFAMGTGLVFFAQLR